MFPKVFEDCLSCAKPMQGIVCHSLREICHECGGQALNDHKELLAERKRDRGEAA